MWQAGVEKGNSLLLQLVSGVWTVFKIQMDIQYVLIIDQIYLIP